MYTWCECVCAIFVAVRTNAVTEPGGVVRKSEKGLLGSYARAEHLQCDAEKRKVGGASLGTRTELGHEPIIVLVMAWVRRILLNRFINQGSSWRRCRGFPTHSPTRTSLVPPFLKTLLKLRKRMRGTCDVL